VNEGKTQVTLRVGMVAPEGAAVPDGYGILFDGKAWAAAERIDGRVGWSGPIRQHPASAVSDAWVRATGATPATRFAERYIARFERKA